MAATTQVTVTTAWSKLSDGDCTVQAVYADDFYQISVNLTAPTDEASIITKLGEPIHFAYGTAIWCKLPSNSNRASAVVNVIK